MTAAAMLRGDTRQLIFTLVLFVLVLNAADDTMRLVPDGPMFLVVLAVGVFAIATAGLELAGRPSHQIGTISAILGIMLGLWVVFTAPSPHPAPAAPWVPVLVLWLVLMSSRGPEAVAATPMRL